MACSTTRRATAAKPCSKALFERCLKDGNYILALTTPTGREADIRLLLSGSRGKLRTACFGPYTDGCNWDIRPEVVEPFQSEYLAYMGAHPMRSAFKKGFDIPTGGSDLTFSIPRGEESEMALAGRAVHLQSGQSCPANPSEILKLTHYRICGLPCLHGHVYTKEG